MGASLSQVPPAILNKLIPFCKSPKNFLLFCGSPGIGKTHFCAALSEWALRNFMTVRYWKEAELLKKLRNSMDAYKGDYLEHLKEMVNHDFLIYDDIGSTGSTEWREEVLFEILDTRYNSMLPTVFTSNLSKNEFKNMYHPRIYDRLFARENIIIEVQGESYRQKA